MNPNTLAGTAPVAALAHDAPTLDTAALRGATAREVQESSPFVTGVATLAEQVLAVTGAASTA